MKRKHLVAFTGAGVSADSGISTFRDANGLWDNYRIEDVCSVDALENNLEELLHFYNIRRRELMGVSPNSGHIALANLERYFKVTVVTQNVDNLHERAGSSSVLHIHGELTKCRSIKDESYIRTIEGDILPGDLCPKGGQLRPHIVFFGESVPLYEEAAKIIMDADLFLVAGTSLAVYPAAGLVRVVGRGVPIYSINPNPVEVGGVDVIQIEEKFVSGMTKLAPILVEKYYNL
ncbi:MAG: Sir2 family NAD-dependent protein deacetylase [Bacteroidales bacterium]